MKIKVDLLTRDDQNDEFAVYLVENGPWPEDAMDERLRQLQTRLNGVLDLAFSGQLAERYPETRGARLRLQVDCYDDAPKIVIALVRAFRDMLAADAGVRAELSAAHKLVKDLRVVCREDMGRNR